MLTGKHAVITGAGRGIGLAIAEALAGAGANLTLLGRDAGRLQAAAAGLPRLDAVFTASVDVTDRAALDQALAAASERFGPVAVLVNNAGSAESAPFGKTDAELWERMLAVNLSGVFHCTQAALPGLLQSAGAGYARVVNVASTAGLTGYAYVAAYCAAKHGVVGLTRALAKEWAKKGITINAVCPGYTETDLVKDAVAKIVAKTGRDEAAARAELAAANPQGRLVQPEEVAAAVLWLCSPAAAAVTGIALPVAGGEVV